ncbi:hypothetical protein [Legionella fallonii]|uniref:Uncharacterized protein n=1 Tax=Legionella fallonii LLAP-10 TaxID=1212491 RepID=A0A098G9L2_9GAMM|nr:hypothetical protein [Legionella fallonii]CEG58679.1 protein of unknown function [Legionella fallonii LLAP-10]
MDLNTLTSQSPKIMTVIENIKNDPNFFNELKANPQEALNKIGVELNEEELGWIQKIESLSQLGVGNLQELEEEAVGMLAKIKGLLGMK